MKRAANGKKQKINVCRDVCSCRCLCSSLCDMLLSLLLACYLCCLTPCVLLFHPAVHVCLHRPRCQPVLLPYWDCTRSALHCTAAPLGLFSIFSRAIGQHTYALQAAVITLSHTVALFFLYSLLIYTLFVLSIAFAYTHNTQQPHAHTR